MIDTIKKALKMTAEHSGITDPVVHLEYPDDISHGDFSTNLAMVYAKMLKINPKILAEKIVAEFNKDLPDMVLPATVAGPGFINLHLSREYFIGQIKTILTEGVDYGKSDIGKGKTVLVEYSSPNIAKPFTVGHLRSTIIGDAIANILDFLGYKVIRDNHLGDWGTQFGKLLVALEKWGNLADLEKNKSPIKELVALYVRFHNEAELDASLEVEARKKFQHLEAGTDEEIKEIWKKCVELSKKEFTRIYEQLDVKFDTQIGESFYATPEMVDGVSQELNAKGLVKESEGAQVVFFEGEKYPPLIIRKTDGTSIYATRDLAADRYRKKEYGKDIIIINEVGADQTLYFKQLFEVEKMLGWFVDSERVHISHGLLRLKEGKISTRKGHAIWLEDLIRESIDRAAKINPDSAHDVAMAALKFNDLKRESIQDIIFNWEEMMSMAGDSGPYLQYSCARARSVIAKAEGLSIKAHLDSKPLASPQTETLEKFLVRFPEIVQRAGKEYKSNILAVYLITIGALFNSFYAQNVIADENDKSAPYRVALTKAFDIVMTSGLKLLGIKVPKRM